MTCAQLCRSSILSLFTFVKLENEIVHDLLIFRFSMEDNNELVRPWELLSPDPDLPLTH